jgi:hypothetical protein
MIDIIPLNWYTETPIDFEHKQYVILSYLQTVDSHFIQKRLSPHLLHMESMIIEMLNFQESLGSMRKRFDKERYIFLFNDNPKLKGEKNILIEEIEEVVDFSIPLIQNRVDLGHKILAKNNQLLF